MFPVKRWTPECAEILARMVKGGRTDQEIAEHIAKRTGWRPERRTVMAYRQAAGLGTCFQAGWWKRRILIRDRMVA
jgi:hypothetical protein